MRSFFCTQESDASLHSENQDLSELHSVSCQGSKPDLRFLSTLTLLSKHKSFSKVSSFQSVYGSQFFSFPPLPKTILYPVIPIRIRLKNCDVLLFMIQSAIEFVSLFSFSTRTFPLNKKIRKISGLPITSCLSFLF